MSNQLIPLSQAREFWREVVDPRGIGLPNAIAAEIGAFTNEPVDLVLQKMATGVEDFKASWLAAAIDGNDERAVQRFYEDQFVEAYELANWHCGRTNAEPPMNYARAALFARARGLKRALDFGSGIGTGSLALASVGCEVHSADVARRLLTLVHHRLTARGYTPHTVSLSEEQRPPTSYFDIITCFDVLEHVPDQLQKLRELEGYLAPGGVLLVNLMLDSSDPNRPMHISSAGSWLPLVRKTGLQPVWADCSTEIKVLRRHRTSRLQNIIASVVDTAQGLR